MTKAELKKLKTATEKLTKWESSAKAFGHYSIFEKDVTPTKKTDRLYEFWCLMKILNDLLENYNITLIPDSRPDKKIFPQAPSPKKGFAYFVIENKRDALDKFQVCYGTEIKLSAAPTTTFAPDISIQKYDSTDDPDETMVELIMDAKFKYSNSKKLPKNQLDSFIQWVNALQTQNADTIPLQFNLLNELKANCLLTNGRALVDQEDYCKLNKIKQVEQFDIETTFNTIG